MYRYRKKPIIVEAMQLRTDNVHHVMGWIGPDACGRRQDRLGHGILIDTKEGVHLATYGDYVIKGIQGEFYPCKPDIFEATYEPVPDRSEGSYGR